MFRWPIRIAGALLLLFHAWLLAAHASSGQLLEPERLLRWLIAAGLAVGLIVLRRRGATLFGRRAIIVWLLASLLHVPSIASRLDAFDTPVAITLTELALASVAVGLGLRFAGRVARERSTPRRAEIGATERGPALAISPLAFPNLSSRPPPRA